MEISTFLIIIVVVVVAWILFRLLLKVTGLIFRVGCIVIFALAALAFLFFFIL